MHIQRGIKFILHKRNPNQAQNLGIRLRVTLRGKTPIDFPLGFSTDIENWDASEQMAIGGDDMAAINRTIKEWRNTLDEIFARYELIEKRTPEPDELKDLFNDTIGRQTDLKKELDKLEAEQNPGFFKVFDIFMIKTGKQNQWTESTFKKFRTIKRTLRDYDKKLSFDTITHDKMQGYMESLLKAGKKNTTVAKDISFVRWFLHWAYLNGSYNGNLHETFKPKLKGTDGASKEIIFLTRDEVNKLEEWQFKPEQKALERVRDVFLFCCFTGLRYSDVAKLKKADVKQGYIDVVTQKTNDSLKIELNRHSQAIIDKYKDAGAWDGFALPVISNQKMNDALKDLGKLCGIDDPVRIVYFKGNERCEDVKPKYEVLTTHCARRTFVVSALQLGIPSEVIMRWTGHSSFKAMKPYYKIVDETKEKAMTKFDDF